LCDENGIGGCGEYFGDNYAHLGRINVFYHEALGGKYVPRAVLFDFEPGVIGAVSLSQTDPSAPATRRTIRAGKNLATGHYKRVTSSSGTL
jgi:tubulin beta